MSVLALKMNWVAEFMDTLPNLVRPRHLQSLRTWLEYHNGAANFTEAYQWTMWNTADGIMEIAWWSLRSRTHDEPFCFQSALYHFLWYHYHEDFFWSIQDGAYLGVPPSDACPSLRAARHLGNDRSGMAGRKLMSVENRLEYAARATEIMLAGERGLQLHDPQPALWEALLLGNDLWVEPEPNRTWEALVGRWRLYYQDGREAALVIAGNGMALPEQPPSETLRIGRLVEADGGEHRLDDVDRSGSYQLLSLDGVGRLMIRRWDKKNASWLAGTGFRRVVPRAHCKHRTVEGLLRSYAELDSARSATQ